MLADELTVLSAEDVVDSAVLVNSKAAVKKESNFVPSRAMAGQPGYDDDEDENYNKGCYYFVACLDALWIL